MCAKYFMSSKLEHVEYEFHWINCLKTLRSIIFTAFFAISYRNSIDAILPEKLMY